MFVVDETFLLVLQPCVTTSPWEPVPMEAPVWSLTCVTVPWGTVNPSVTVSLIQL